MAEYLILEKQAHLCNCFKISSQQTEAARPVFGKYYREPKKSGPIPFHLIGSLVRSMKKDHYVSDTGDVVYYQTDPELYGPNNSST